MAIAYNTRIIRTDLLVHLDAGNKKSYPGTGTSWFDLSGNNYTNSLVNGPTYDSANGGSIYFDGTNDVARKPSAPYYALSTSVISISVWTRVNTHGNFHNFVVNNWVGNGWALYSDATNWTFGVGQSGTQYNAIAAHSNSTAWTNLCGTYDGSAVRLYRNGVLTQSTTLVSATLTTGLNVDIGQVSRPSPYRISQVMIHNRALTASEVNLNFNATRGRYGI